jgi:hypothetical protein
VSLTALAIAITVWLKNSVLGIVLLSAFGNWVFVSALKGRRKFGRRVARRLLAPYYVHSAALEEHHEADGMPLIIYIAYQLARLIAYTATSVLFWLIAVIVFSDSMNVSGKLAPGLNSTAVLITVTIIAAIVFNVQAVRALVVLKLLYVSQVDPLVKNMPPNQREMAMKALDTALGKKPEPE